MTSAAIIQARMGSTRLPGKTLTEIGHGTPLDWITARAGAASLVDEVIVATSFNPDDDAIANRCADLGIACARGHPDDVLTRYRSAVELTDASVIVRLTADCPFVEPSIIDSTITTLATGGRTVADYASTSLDGSYPRGLDVEAVRRDSLEVAAAEATDPDEREHVTLFIYRRPTRFLCLPVPSPVWARRPNLRFTIDEAADLHLVREVIRITGGTPESLRGEEVVALLDAHPELASINATVVHRNVR